MKLSNCILFKGTKTVIDNIDIVNLPNGFIIANEGDKSYRMGIILSGHVLIKAYTSGGKHFTVNSLKEGDIFGDMLIFSNEYDSYPGALITVGETKVAFIEHKVFKEMILHDKVLLNSFLNLLSNKSVKMNYKSKLLSQDSVRDKILFYLHQEKRVQKTDIIALNMTKEELANILFIQRPSLSRELIKMKVEGLIDYDRYTITIK
ncbi:MAG: Crp/Fnr family transcriptional regulator [Candidatus Izemoplasma sp.]